MLKNFLRGFTHVIYPLRYLVFVSLGCIVLFGMNNCVPEMSDINPPQNVEKKY